MLLFGMGYTIMAQNIHFLYFAPTATLNNAFGEANTSGWVDASNNPILPGYRKVEITSSNQATFRTIASPMMRRTRDSLSTANTQLRRKINRILALSDGKVTDIVVMMVDDRTGTQPHNRLCQGTINNLTAIWPCASNWRVSNNVYRARIMFGELAAAQDNAGAGAFKRWESTLLHEFSHTQMLNDTSGVNKWGHNGISISYGGDAGHWFVELQADEQQPMDEGFASFWGLEHNPVMATELVAFLNRKDERFLLGSHSFLTGIPEMWNAPHQVVGTATVPPPDANGQRFITFPGYNPIELVAAHIQTGSSYMLRKYKWLDVPGKFVLYNENMSQAYFYLYHRYAFASQDTALSKLLSAAKVLTIPNQRYRYPAHVANMLANYMERYANSPRGQQEAANRTLTSSMFALGLYDLLGHFGQSDADLRRQFTINAATYIPHTPVPRALNEYMNRRAQVKARVCPFISGNADCRQTNANIDMLRAVEELRTFFREPSTIIRN